MADSRIVATVQALELGEFRNGTLRSTVFVETIDVDRLSIELLINEVDLPDGAEPAIWSGSARVEELNADRTAGRLTFENAGQVQQEPGSSDPPSDWPATLSGTISWVCDPW